MLIIDEIRCFYKNRQDKLLLRRRFPYSFTTVEHYESSHKIHYWKKVIRKEGEYRKIFYYHHRNEDGLVYREEQIGKKTFEKYKNRPDFLVYRSVSIDPHKIITGSQMSIRDNWLGKEVYIKKMSQKYDINPEIPIAGQIKKTEFNMDKKEVKIYYHYEKGKITAQVERFNRDDLQGQNKVGDMNDKEAEESKQQQIFKRILEMEHLCLDEIKGQEKANMQNTEDRRKSEADIRELKNKIEDKDFMEEKYKKVLVKTVEKKARDKMKMDKKKDQEENEKESIKDDLLPILKKLGFESTELDEEQAV